MPHCGLDERGGRRVKSGGRASSEPSNHGPTIEMKPIGVVRSPHRDTSDIPKGPGAKHSAEGSLELRPEYEEGLQDIEGFSHLFVL